jgi:hypothetical protein
MGSPVLTDKTQVQCPHGGLAKVIPSSTKAKAESGAVLTVSDQHLVSGCAFMKGPVPSPCIRVQWQNPSKKANAVGTAILTSASVGLCYAGDGTPQGPAVVIATTRSTAL